MLQEKIATYLTNKTKNLIRFETIFFIVVGILTMIFPYPMEVGFDYAFGAACILYGVIELAYYASSTAEVTPATVWVPFIIALSAVSIGIILFIDGLLFIKTFLGVWLFTFGVFQIYRVTQQYKTLKFWGLTLLCGVASVFFSLVMWFDWPVSGIQNVGMFIGPNLIILAITIWFNNRDLFSNNQSS